eukprot:8167653-Alexandrium_andersonii.AAC.1
MSASLVGSEMCIRDRSQPCHGPQSGGASISPSRVRTADGCREALPEGPVSYTHLTLPTICSV